MKAVEEVIVSHACRERVGTLIKKKGYWISRLGGDSFWERACLMHGRD